MNPPDPDSQLDALFTRARARRPDTSSTEFAFETRLLARLRAERDTGSVWAMVSWRLAPFFAACVMALAVWQSELSSDAADAAAYASLDSTDTTDWGDDLN